MTTTVGGRVTDAVLQDLAYIGYLVEQKAPDVSGQVYDPATGLVQTVVEPAHPAAGQ